MYAEEKVGRWVGISSVRFKRRRCEHYCVTRGRTCIGEENSEGCRGGFNRFLDIPSIEVLQYVPG